MSMPQPIHVALVGSTDDIVHKAINYFRLSAPGIGAPYLASLEPMPSDPIQRFSDIPHSLIHLWVALDKDSLFAAQQRYAIDSEDESYARGFYEHSLPEACVLVEFDGFSRTAKKLFEELAQTIIRAWYDSS